MYQSTHIVSKQSAVPAIIEFYYEKWKGENAIKLFFQIRKEFVGVSRGRIQHWINNNRNHCKRNPVYGNQDTLKPIVWHQKHLKVCRLK